MSTMPFLKWAGGKRWLVQSEFVRRLPRFKRYIEPFLGGGAMLFWLRPSSGVVSDINPELIHLYRMMRNHPNKLFQAMSAHSLLHSKNYYYAMRGSIPEDDVGKAARTLYLNRTCWNGLYRVNQRGMFNVPMGTKDTVLFEGEDFSAVAAVLESLSIRCEDFERVIDDAEEGDLIFVDPPYTVAHNMNGFVRYNERMFRWEDQIRLRNALVSASQRGAMILMTNADHPSVRSLYSNVAHYRELERSSIISGTVVGRRRTTEALISFNVPLPD